MLAHVYKESGIIIFASLVHVDWNNNIIQMFWKALTNSIVSAFLHLLVIPNYKSTLVFFCLWEGSVMKRYLDKTVDFRWFKVINMYFKPLTLLNIQVWFLLTLVHFPDVFNSKYVFALLIIKWVNSFLSNVNFNILLYIPRASQKDPWRFETQLMYLINFCILRTITSLNPLPHVNVGLEQWSTCFWRT